MYRCRWGKMDEMEERCEERSEDDQRRAELSRVASKAEKQKRVCACCARSSSVTCDLSVSMSSLLSLCFSALQCMHARTHAHTHARTHARRIQIQYTRLPCSGPARRTPRPVCPGAVPFLTVLLFFFFFLSRKSKGKERRARTFAALLPAQVSYAAQPGRSAADSTRPSFESFPTLLSFQNEQKLGFALPFWLGIGRTFKDTAVFHDRNSPGSEWLKHNSVAIAVSEAKGIPICLASKEGV